METPTKPVMDIAPPPKMPLSPSSPSEPVHPAPNVPTQENQTQPTTAKTDRSKDKLPQAKSPVPQASPHVSTFPTGIVALTIFVMIALAGLAIAVYSTSAK